MNRELNAKVVAKITGGDGRNYLRASLSDIPVNLPKKAKYL